MPEPTTDPASVLPTATGPDDPYSRTNETFPTLDDDQVARIVEFGRVEDAPAGTVLFERDQRRVDFFLVLDGHVEIYEPGPDAAPVVMTIHARHQFTGELDLFNDRAILVGGRMGVDGRLARLDRASFRRMLAAEPDIAQIVMRAFILRRAGFLAHDQAAVTVIGPRHDADTLRIRRFLTRNDHPFVSRSLDAPDEAERETAEQLLSARDLSAADAPFVLSERSAALVRPGNAELADWLGLAETLDPGHTFDVAVVGAGPAGLAAAVYSASEGLDTVVIEADAPGGQAGTSSRIENYLGFPTGVSGQQLASRAEVQAQKFGARIVVARRVVGLRTDGASFVLELDDERPVAARAVVVATGARYRTLEHLENIERYEGSGIHYAATAMEAALSEGEEVVVVGGGNSAGQAAMFLSRSAAHVHILIRGERLAASMSDYLFTRIEATDRVTVHERTEITVLHGERLLEQVTWRDADGAEQTHAVRNVFLMLGAQPNSDWLDGVVALDAKGFVRTAADPAHATVHETSCPGVYAVGDIRAGSVKRVASAVGQGSVVVSEIHDRLAAAT